MEGISIHKVLDEIKGELKSLRADNAALRASQQAMQQELTRYKGFIGGVLFVVSAVAAALGIVAAFIKTGGH
tara:strand:- start:690 stop:905 length:216 start_codon:yes stop_codon:yes gene_type:complete